MLVATIAAPPVLHPGLNNVFGKAKFKVDSGVTRYLGEFNVTSDCVSACLSFSKDGQQCFSFTHHLPNMPTNWAGLCYGIVDHSWKPMPDNSDPPVITSAKILWPQEDCGAGAPTGCTWQVDPWCLSPQNKYDERTLTTAAAAAACAADPRCLGFSLDASGPATSNSSSSGTPVAHSFFNGTTGGPGGCWARRRHFALAADPYRTGYHYQPGKGHWMNDPVRGEGLDPSTSSTTHITAAVTTTLATATAAATLTPEIGGSQLACAERSNVLRRPLYTSLLLSNGSQRTLTLFLTYCGVNVFLPLALPRVLHHGMIP